MMGGETSAHLRHEWVNHVRREWFRQLEEQDDGELCQRQGGLFRWGDIVE